MSTKTHLSLALAVALAGAGFAVSAAPIDTGTAEAATEVATEADTAVAYEAAPPPKTARERKFDRECLRFTGSRVIADPQSNTGKDQSEGTPRRCLMANGAVYTREDIDRTGATTVKEALQAVDPRVF